MVQVLNLLDGPFAAVSAAVERHGFALWVGSGISFGRAPSIGPMLERVLEHLRQRVDPDLADCKFRRALNEAIEMSGLKPARRSVLQFALPFANWPEREDIIGGLSNRYSEVLDIRLQGESDDYLLWEAVDVRTTYGTLHDPDCEHLCIAMLVMEGGIIDIASANWDGLIEAAVRRLSGGARLVQVVVDPNHLRDPPARARLIKFHGCAVHCIEDPNTYRHCLIAARSQITFWDHNPVLTALRDELRTIATQSGALMVGLSLQDTNLQSLFAAARAALPWPWPSAPAAQGHQGKNVSEPKEKRVTTTLTTAQIYSLLRVEVGRLEYDTSRKTAIGPSDTLPNSPGWQNSCRNEHGLRARLDLPAPAEAR